MPLKGKNCSECKGKVQKVAHLYKSMPGRNWRKSVNSHVHPCLHEWFLLIIWSCTCGPRLTYPKYTVIVSAACQMSHLGENSIQPSFKSKRLAVATTKFLFGMRDCTASTVMLARPIFQSCWGFCTCGHAHVRSHVSPGMDCYITLYSWQSCNKIYNTIPAIW